MEDKVRKLLFSLLPGRDLVFKESTGSGPGGQHRNRTKSTITLTHPESGVTVKAGDEKSQHRNKRTALRRLIVNKKFKNWVRVQAAMIEQGYRNIEEKVDALMKKENLKVEYITKFTCDGCGKQKTMLSPNRLDRNLPPGWKETKEKTHQCRTCQTRTSK